jgi:hypothetical protein
MFSPYSSPVAEPVLSPVAWSINGDLSEAISALFAAGEQGAWYDPSDFSTLYQDSAGTTPVTAVGQPVGRILDKSGKGNHATQPTAASRPVLQQDSNGLAYLAFDGVDDFLVTNSIDFSLTDKMTVIAGVRKLSDAAAGIIAELGPTTATTIGSFGLYSSGLLSDANRRTYGTNLNAGAEIGGGAPGYPSPSTNVVTAIFDIAGATPTDEQKLRVNGAVVGLTFSSTSPAGIGNFGNYPLNMGRRLTGSALPFNGRLYSLVIRGAASTTAQIEAAERYVNANTGAY